MKTPTKRYDPISWNDNGPGWDYNDFCIKECDDGDYVKLEDAEKLETELDDMTKQRDRLQTALTRALETVAEFAGHRASALLLLDVFSGCIRTGTIPGKGSDCDLRLRAAIEPVRGGDQTKMKS